MAAWIVLVLDWCGVWHLREMGCSRRFVRDFSYIWMLARSIGVQEPAPLEDEDEDDMPQRPLLAPLQERKLSTTARCLP
jgi:hypothetical protein